jgi:hypothetical protein
MLSDLMDHHDTSETDCCGTNTPCSHDGCELVENGAYHWSDNLSKLATPDLLSRTCLLLFQLIPPYVCDESILPAGSDDKPSGWVPTWPFARRTALPARAPDCLV